MKKILLLACMALAVISCEKDPDMGQLDSAMPVYTDYDSQADFNKFQTYFLPDSILEAGSYRATYWKDENAQKLIKEVEAQMNARGYLRITDPAQKDEADLGIQLSYIQETTHVVSGGGYWNGWWDYGFWGPWWGGWYYPYTVSYSYNTNSLIMEMVDLSAQGTENAKLPVIWYANASGYQYNSRYDLQLMSDAIDQAFEQSPYIQSNK